MDARKTITEHHPEYHELVKTKQLLMSTLLGILAVVAFGGFFVSQLSTNKGPELEGAILAPLPDVVVEEIGQASGPEAANHLAAVLKLHPLEPRVGVHFSSESRELYWIADRSNPQTSVLVERAGNPNGTRLETRWIGNLEERLSWAQDHGTFEAPDLEPGQSRNLYH